MTPPSVATEGRQLLIVEDDPGLQMQMRWCFADGVDVHTAGDEATAMAFLASVAPQVVVLDLGIPPEPGGTSAGFRVLEHIVSADTSPVAKVIVVTGREEHEHALRAVALGAYDYHRKPIEAETLRFAVERAFRLFELEAENARLRPYFGNQPLQGLITSSVAMQAMCRMVERVAPTDVTVLIGGETGTGKELIARALHQLSPRTRRSFSAINCAAIPETLLESELFGYEKGAFTGASAQKKGRIELADHGTLFLDEIGDMPLPLQAKMLRFLQERNIERIGGRQSIDVDVRVLCATHRDLRAMIAAGTFREDLYYRISEIRIDIPPLRDRVGDSVVLARAFLERLQVELKRRRLRFSEEALQAIGAHSWPGNVRELENRVKRAAIMADGDAIHPADLELAAPEVAAEFDLKSRLARTERDAVLQALAHADNNLTRAAALLGISRPTIYTLIARNGIRVAEED